MLVVHLLFAQGLTPLHLAAQYGHWRVAAYLVASGQVRESANQHVHILVCVSASVFVCVRVCLCVCVCMRVYVTALACAMLFRRDVS